MEIEKEKISVIIPVYNVEKYLKRCLDDMLIIMLKCTIIINKLT